MSETKDKDCSSDPTPCSAADGSHLPKIGGRSADGLQLALAAPKGRQKNARQVFDEACDEYHAANVKYENAKIALLKACDETDSVSELIATNKQNITDGQ